MYRNGSDSNPFSLLHLTYFSIGNLRTSMFDKYAGNQIARSRNGVNYASSPNLAASMSLSNRNKANWIAENYNYDPSEPLPRTNYTLNRKYFDY